MSGNRDSAAFVVTSLFVRYAVVKTGGKQYRVVTGQVVEIEKIDAVPGSEIELTDVLMVADEGKLTVGQPLVTGARVGARVLAQDRDAKIVVFKYKPKKRYRRTRGHRQALTRLAITDITL
ncbi:MAG TPA: 50S ribosomal protein L21 [Chloroflexota bacterium]|nr:50S ribosomal protein L21 [Chloroflexota bacterium]